MKIPRYLKEGDTIGITCPAGYMPMEKIADCIETLKKWGFKTHVGRTLGNIQENYFSADDDVRRIDFQEMLDNENIHAILCGRGGYGVSRIIDTINFRQFRRDPKWIIGYSDISLLHTHLQNRLGVASLHAPMAAAFMKNPNSIYIKSIRNSLLGKRTKYVVNGHELNIPGEVTAELIGGNLALLAHSIGSVSEPNIKNKILFIEDVGEYIYNIDRMFIQLKRAGWFNKVAGLIIGSFSDMKDTTVPFGKDIYSIIHEHLQSFHFPVAFHFPVGHTERNLALKCGVVHRLKVQKENILLLEE